MPYRLVIFDWEGTLADTLGQFIHIIAEQARQLNLGTLDEVEARRSLDLGLMAIIRNALPALTVEQQRALLEAVQQSLVTRGVGVYLIPGALAFIERLAKAKLELAIATNKGQQSLLSALQMTKLDSFFKVTRSAGLLPAKPNPEMLEEILAEFALTPKDALMIGDSTADIEMASSIGMDALGVDFYQQQQGLLEKRGALAVFDNYEKVAEYLQIPD